MILFDAASARGSTVRNKDLLFLPHAIQILYCEPTAIPGSTAIPWLASAALPVLSTRGAWRCLPEAKTWVLLPLSERRRRPAQNWAGLPGARSAASCHRLWRLPSPGCARSFQEVL